MLRLISWLLFVLGLTQALVAQSSGALIVLIGPPASGKTTHTPEGTGLRADLSGGPDCPESTVFREVQPAGYTGVEPRVDPALNRLVAERLRSIDRSKG